MIGDAPSTGSPALSARAGIALLTLQLRAAIMEAEAAEATNATADHEGAREELRARLDPLLTQRRESLDQSLAEAKAEADAKVASARRAATVMIAQASPPLPSVPVATAGPPARADMPVAVPVVALAVAANSARPEGDESRAPAPETVVQPLLPNDTTVQAEPPKLVLAVADVAAQPTNMAALVEQPFESVAIIAAREAAPQSAQQAATVVIDAEAFARVFATVMASLLDERTASFGPGMTPGQMQAFALSVAPPPPPVKQSFWTHARHPDVLLMGFTMVIVLVVLAAWLA